MYLLESIRILNGKIYNLAYHQDRFEKSQKEIYGLTQHPILRKAIQIPSKFKKGEYKCRVLYDHQIYKIEFIPYVLKEIKSIKLIHADIDYSHKLEKRPLIDKAFSKREKHDDIIIVKDGFITDASYSNLAFKKQDSWFTPTQCLLKGTRRQKLLDTKRINAKKILVKDVHKYSHVSLFNAMIPFKKICLKTECIF